VSDWSVFPYTAPLGYISDKTNYQASGTTRDRVAHTLIDVLLALRGAILEVVAEFAPPHTHNVDGNGEYGTEELVQIGEAFDASRGKGSRRGRINQLATIRSRISCLVASLEP
jgi:hypothetical protein